MPINLADDSMLGQNAGEIGRARASLGYIDRWASSRATEGDAHRSAILTARQTSYPRNREEAVGAFSLPAELKGTFTNPNMLGYADISARISLQQVVRDQALRKYREQVESGKVPEERFYKFSPSSPRHKTSLVLPCTRNVAFFNMASLPAIDKRPSSRASTAMGSVRSKFAPSTYSTRSERIELLEEALETERATKEASLAEIAALRATLKTRQ